MYTLSPNSIPIPDTPVRSGSLTDITYKTVGNHDLKLDLYLPDAVAGPFPLLVYIHGGGWASGDKSEIHQGYRQKLMEKLNANGYAVASIEYRLTNLDDIHFPVPVADCKDAIRWIRRHGAKYSIDTDNIGVWGTSAGAHMAMLLAYAPENEFPGDLHLRGYSSRVNYVLNNYGPTQLSKLFHPQLNPFVLWLVKIFARDKYDIRQARLATFTGLDIENQKDQITKLCEMYSPLKYISRSSVPTLSFHGSADRVVPLAQAKLLKDRLNAVDQQHVIVTYPEEGHGLKTLQPAQVEDIVERSFSFILEHYRTK